MIKHKDQNLKDRGILSEWDGEKMLCTLCHIPMRDIEPSNKDGEFFHPHNRCKNAGQTFHRRVNSPLETFKKKRLRRALKRGAKAARRYRP